MGSWESGISHLFPMFGFLGEMYRFPKSVYPGNGQHWCGGPGSSIRHCHSFRSDVRCSREAANKLPFTRNRIGHYFFLTFAAGISLTNLFYRGFALKIKDFRRALLLCLPLPLPYATRPTLFARIIFDVSLRSQPITSRKYPRMPPSGSV